MKIDIWDKCIDRLKQECSENDSCENFNLWINPLQAKLEGNSLILLAPNEFVIQKVYTLFFSKINNIINELSSDNPLSVCLEIGSASSSFQGTDNDKNTEETCEKAVDNSVDSSLSSKYGNFINKSFMFETFVKGRSNEFAFAAATQVAKNPGCAYNPLLIYGGVGLGKTHLMHAVAHEMLASNPNAKVLYFHSERFVANMVKALQHSAIDEFKNFCRSSDILLMDDIQFIAGKDRSQEEFFHTFNSLLEERKQIILTCDRYPKEISGLEERLKSRFGWGLTVSIEPPELETRVAILMKKAEQFNINLPYDVAFFIAKRIRSNVRELEGALKRVIANSEFTGNSITVDFVKEALRDLLTLQDKLITIENIQKTVAEYYKIKVADLMSKRRSRSVTRPRQIAMTLCKELTNRSFPEIGDAFGGRDHTTVLHACRMVKELFDSDIDIKEDYSNLLRTLTT